MAQAFEYEGLEYNILDEEAATVEVAALSDSSLTSVIIPSVVKVEEVVEEEVEVKEYAVTSIGEYAFYRSNLKEIEIPESVTNIGRCAFSYCSTLERVSLPNNLTHLHSSIFYACSSLSEVIIPESVTEIEDNVFAHCTSLTEIVIPESVKQIHYEAFFDCTTLTKVTVPLSIAADACHRIKYNEGLEVTLTGEEEEVGGFREWTALTKIYLPENARSIGNGAFYGCSGLTEIVIPENVRSIGNYAFYGCTGLTEIVIPKNVTSIDNRAFSGCFGLKEIVIPENVTSIGERAFNDCIRLTEIVIPENVTSIGQYSFSGCIGLTEIVIPENVTDFGRGIVDYCTGIKLLTVPVGGASACSGIGANEDLSVILTGMGEVTGFNGWTGLKEVRIPSGVTTIGADAFNGCTSLSEIVIPESVREIGVNAFYLDVPIEGKGRKIFLNSASPEMYWNNTDWRGNTFLGKGNENTALLVKPELFHTLYTSDTEHAKYYYPQNFEQAGVRYSSVLGEDHYSLRLIEHNPEIEKIALLPLIEAHGTTFSVEGFNPSWNLANNETIKEIYIDLPMSAVPDEFCMNTPALEKVVLSKNVESVGDRAFANSGVKYVRSERDVPPALGENAFGEGGRLQLIVDNNAVTAYKSDEAWTARFDIAGNFEDHEGWAYEIVTSSDMYTQANITEYTGEAAEDNILIIPAQVPHCGEMIDVREVKLSSLPQSYSGILIEESEKDLTINCDLGKLAGKDFTELWVNRPVVKGSECNYMFGGSNVATVTFGDNLDGVSDYILEGATKLKTVNLGANITSIGNYSFKGATGLASRGTLDFMADSNITSIGMHAFEGDRFENILFPETLETIGEAAFMNCGSLEAISIPKYVRVIGNDAFNTCDYVMEITFEGSVREIGDRAFSNLSDLVSLNFRETVGKLGEEAFAKCFSLETVNVKADNVMRRSFADCTELKTISITGNGKVADEVFTDCSKLSEISFDIPEVGNGMALAVNVPALENVNFSDKVEIIGADAFTDISSLQSAVFGTGLKEIGERAFKNHGLSEIVFPDSDTLNAQLNIGEEAFQSSMQNVRVNLGSITKSVGANAFRTMLLSSLDLGSSVEVIGAAAFRSSSQLETLRIPSSVKRIGREALEIGSMKHFIVEYNPEPLVWESISDQMAGNISVTDLAEIDRIFVGTKGTQQLIYLSAQIKSYEDSFLCASMPELRLGTNIDAPTLDLIMPKVSTNYAFAKRSEFDNVRIGKGIRSLTVTPEIEVYKGLLNTTQVNNLLIEDGLEELHGSLYIPEDSPMEVLSLPGTLKKLDCSFVGQYEGEVSSGIKKLIIRDGEGDILPSDENIRFFGLPNLEEVYLGKNLEGIRFGENKKLAKVVVGDKVKAIGTELFRDCEALTNAIMSDSVEELRQGAFQNCTALNVLSMSETLATVGENAYAGCTGFERIVPRGAVPAEGNAGFNREVEQNVPVIPMVKDAIADYQDSDLFYRFKNWDVPEGNVAAEVIIDPETEDELADAEVGKTYTMPEFVISYIYEPEEEEEPEGDQNVDIRPYPRSRAKAAEPSFGFYYFTPTPEAVSVNQEGMVTILSKEPGEVWVYYLDGSDRKGVVGVNNSDYIRGDINGDGILDSMDINMLTEIVCASEASEVPMKVSDMNRDGVLDSMDINLLVEKCAGIENAIAE